VTSPDRARWRLSAAWLAAALAMAAVAFFRLELSFDLSAFFPRQTVLAHDILIEQIRQGPASRLLVIGIDGAGPEELADASDRMKQLLAASPYFVAVMNGEFDADTAAVPTPIDRYYLLMRDLDYSGESLRAAVRSRLKDLAFAGGAALLDIIARDPFLATLDILEGLSQAEVAGDLWFGADGSAVLMAETRATSIDIEAQRAAIGAIRDAFRELPGAENLLIDITGVGAFSVELQQTIRAEATMRSILASVALILVLLIVFRKPRLVLLGALPLGMGFLAGMAVVGLLFETVHGITLAFGFTMLGVAIDYPLHLFSHARETSGQLAIRRIWPTMRLGVISTAVAYLALVFSGSQGLAQLGSFTVAGILVAVLVTRTWLPPFVGETAAVADESGGPARPPSLVWAGGLLVLVAACVIGWHSAATGLWDDELSSLSPVPAARLAADRDLRAAAATPDMRYQLVLHNDSLQGLLEDCERTDPLLSAAKGDGLLVSWRAVCQLLPSSARQESRRLAIPEQEELRERLNSAVEGTPFRQGAFEPFIESASLARQLKPLQPSLLRATPLRSWLDAHLVEFDSVAVALVSLTGPDPELLAARVAEWPVAAEIVDLQAASVDLMRDYRNGALRVITVATLLILALLWFVRGDLRQMAWVGLTVAASLAATVAVITVVQGALTVMHLVALLLVLGLGLDYALFLSRTESATERAWTRKGVFACAASTTLAFGILAGSSIPVLAYLGLTVATGSATSYMLAYVGSRGWQQSVS
jgi:predicted exporter